MHPAFHVKPTLEQVVNCPICGGANKAVVFGVRDGLVSGQTFDLQDCTGCGFRFTDPRPAQDDIDLYYRSDQYSSHAGQGRSVWDHAYRNVRRLAMHMKRRTISRFHRSGSLLDLGCGTGEFLSHMANRGYAVTGIEPSAAARKQAFDRHGLAPFPSTADLPSKVEFQVITLWHVLEHIHQLHGTIQLLTESLAEDGVLVIAVPDRSSWDCHHYGHQWAAWDVPRHLWHFRSVDVVALLSAHGLVVVDRKPMWFDAMYISILSERNRGRGPLATFMAGLLLGSWSNLVALFTSRSSSSVIYVAKRGKVAASAADRVLPPFGTLAGRGST